MGFSIVETYLNGIHLIKADAYEDDRGLFMESYHKDSFAELGITDEFVQENHSISALGVIRGMHFQIPPYQHAKVVYVPTGHIIDVVLDIRKESPTYGKFEEFNLSAESGIVLYISPGLAHGFESLEDGSCVTYLQTTAHSPERDSGIRFDSFGKVWQTESPIISERDATFTVFSEYSSPFN